MTFEPPVTPLQLKGGLQITQEVGMNFTVAKSVEILERTPEVLTALLQNLSSDWISVNEGGNTWTAHGVVAHLITGEKTDWIPRMEIILSDKKDKRFVPFDQLGHVSESNGKSLKELLEEFKSLRKKNVEILRSRKLTAKDLAKTGIHPELGKVKLSQHLATWVVHDLDHLSQIARVMGKQYLEDVGPWVQYLKVLRQ